MCFILFLSLLAARIAHVLCADLAAVYKNDVLLLKNVSRDSSAFPLTLSQAKIAIQHNLTYPVAIEYHTPNNTILVSDVVEEVSSIHLIDLNSQLPYISQPFFKRISLSVIDTLAFDLSTENLFWRDANAYNPGIFRLNISSPYFRRDDVEKFIVLPSSSTQNSSGLAINFCTGQIFWALTNGNHSEIRVSSINGSVQRVIRKTEDFHRILGLTYFTGRNELLWVEVSGNVTNGSCTFLRQNVSENIEVLAEVENCYPFSLASDETHLYWSDWIRQGIMRMSLSDSMEVVKLVHCPSVESAGGFHSGAFQIVLISNVTHISVCGDADAGRQSGGSPPSGAKEVHKESSYGNVVHTDGEPHGVISEQGRNTNKQGSLPSGHYEKMKLHRADTSSHGSEGRMNSSIDLPSEGCLPDNCEPVPTLAGWYLGAHLNCEMAAYILIGLMGLSVFLVINTVVLSVYVCILRRRLTNSFTRLTEETTSGRKRRRVRRYFSGLEVQAGEKRPQCPKPDDGVHIAIEDCCQMTLCETPCYTSVQKQGRKYLTNSPKSEDRSHLLDAEF